VDVDVDVDASDDWVDEAGVCTAKGVEVARKMASAGVNIKAVLELMCTKPMSTATYFCPGDAQSFSDFHHYALDFPLYTHFTSPIRRYADVVVHRLLALALDRQAADHINNPIPLPPSLSPSSVALIADHCNYRKANAKKAQDTSRQIYLIDYIRRYHTSSSSSSSLLEPSSSPSAASSASGIVRGEPLRDEAVLLSMGDKSFDVMLNRLGMERRVRLEDIDAKSAQIITDPITKQKSLQIAWSAHSTPISYSTTDVLMVVLGAKLSPPVDLTVRVVAEAVTVKQTS